MGFILPAMHGFSCTNYVAPTLIYRAQFLDTNGQYQIPTGITSVIVQVEGSAVCSISSGSVTSGQVFSVSGIIDNLSDFVSVSWGITEFNHSFENITEVFADAGYYYDISDSSDRKLVYLYAVDNGASISYEKSASHPTQGTYSLKLTGTSPVESIGSMMDINGGGFIDLTGKTSVSIDYYIGSTTSNCFLGMAVLDGAYVGTGEAAANKVTGNSGTLTLTTSKMTTDGVDISDITQINVTVGFMSPATGTIEIYFDNFRTN